MDPMLPKPNEQNVLRTKEDRYSLAWKENRNKSRHLKNAEKTKNSAIRAYVHCTQGFFPFPPF